MDIARYQRQAHKLDDNKRLLVSILGLVGEAGSVQTAVKKRLLTRQARHLRKDELKEELGDYLWYLASICSLNSVAIPLNQVALAASGTVVPQRMSFGDLQDALKAKGGAGRSDAVVELARVAIDIQQLVVRI